MQQKKDDRAINTPAERRLAAILSADVVDYTRLVAEDDARTLAAMNTHRAAIAGLVRLHSGRIVDAVGDNVLAEFASAVDAVECALEIQSHTAETESGNGASQLRFRIGINVGELVVDGERIAGDGVNIAARVQALAPPGGVAITGTVLDHVADRLPVEVRDQGQKELKNVPRPVRVLFVDTHDSQQPGTSTTDAVPGFAGRHAIAVLPFTNLSQDVEQEYFAQGLAEDLINRLSALRLYPVIARNSSFAYKGDDRDAREIGKLLGAHYLVSGSVRRSGNKIRVNVALVHTHDQTQLWSQRYDRELSDIFELQDEITESIAASLSPVLSHSEIRHAMQRTPQDLDSWDCIHRGIWHLTQGTRDDNIAAKKWAQRALEMKTDSASAYTLMAFAHQYDIIYKWSESQEDSTRLAVQTAEKAVALDPDDPMALTALGYACNLTGNQLRAITLLERATHLNPSSALGHWALGSALTLAWRPDEGIPMIQKAIRLSPGDPLMHEFLFSLGAAHFVAGRYEQAIEYARKSLAARPGQPGAMRLLAASLGFLGKGEEGAAALQEMMTLVPFMSESHLKTFLPADIADLYLRGMRAAGWSR
ncbi:MAG: adenylate/guanylate cyclase domain-containing protein [Gammaproteobacteria bacterium]|nr:adenylate/guanylate cyclase domain-containing protein [Gammaproteobacteria bacterium]NNF60091.1 adenylate/guanylate cyclase domain-containing protein [Gammaproteobacteria bacterium]NNM19853.1 adenylate/guanylate cyclase domain-containing protein [Gammaproteobacteria bacterium]